MFLSKFFKFLSSDMAIDLGTANTLVYLKGKGVVLNEPSIVAVKYEGSSHIPYAFGNEAKLMVGKTPAKIHAIKPLKDGVIADFKVAEEMLRYFITTVKSGSPLVKPTIIICVPSTSTSVERRAIQDTGEGAGAREVFLIEEPMAAAIGAGLDVTAPTGSMVVDIGGGTTEIAVLSLGGVVYGDSLRIGGNKMDEAIIAYIRKKFNLLVGESTAEKIKHEIGCAVVLNGAEQRTMKIRGRYVTDGIPREIEIKEEDVAEALSECVHKIVSAIKVALEATPPELSADIVMKGIVMTGGGALLRNLDVAIQREINLPVITADEPLNCVVRGSGIVLEAMDAFRHVLFRQD